MTLAVLTVATLFSAPVSAGDDRFVTSGTARARALAMGSAYHSVEDDFSAGFYNPGAFKLNASKDEKRFRLFFNPAAGFVSFYDYSTHDYDFDRDDKLTFAEALLSLSSFFKGMAYTTPMVDFGLGLGEEVICRGDGTGHAARMFTVENLNRCSFHSVFANLKIAPPVSLGIAGTLYSSRLEGERKFGRGFSFGVLLKPNPKMNVGIVYNEMPADFADARMELECIENGSATSGISYHPDDKTVLSIDLRTVNKENQPTSRQIHAGFERRVGERLALRAGYYRRKSTDVRSGRR